MEEKELKEKRKYRFIITLLFTLLLFATAYIFHDKLAVKKDDQKKDNNSSVVEKSINPELADTILFANNGGKSLVAVTSNGKQIDIFNLDENKYEAFYYDYDVEEKVIYISLVDKARKHYIGFIDLKEGNQNYKVKMLKEFDDDKDYFWSIDAYIAKINNYIFVADKGIYKYNIKEDKLEKTDIFNDNRAIWFTKYKSNLIYQFDDDVYMLDVNTNEKNKILSNGTIGYVYRDKLIYYQHKDSTGDETGDKYYIFDINTKDKKVISKEFGIQESDKDFIIPFGDKLYSFDGLDLNVFDGNNINKFYSFTCNDFDGIIEKCTERELSTINTFFKSSNNTLIMIFGDVFDGEAYYVEFNLDTKKVVNNDDDKSYFSEYYLQ